MSGLNSAKLSAQSPPCNKNALPSTTFASCCFKCLVSPAKTKGGKVLILFKTWYHHHAEGLEQEEREQGEGWVGQQAGQGEPVEAGDCREWEATGHGSGRWYHF